MSRATRLFRLDSPSITARNRAMVQAMRHAETMRQKADSFQQIIAALIYAYGDASGRVYLKQEHQIGLSRTQSLSMVQHNENGAYSIEILDSRIADTGAAAAPAAEEAKDSPVQETVPAVAPSDEEPA